MTTVRAESFLTRAQNVLQRIESFEQTNAQEIPGGDLEFSRRSINGMIANVRNRTLPPPELRYRPLARMILDHWPLGHPLGNQISEVEAEYEMLSI